MTTETKTMTISSHDEARALLERAKALRAQAMRRFARAAWARIAGRVDAGTPAHMPGGMPARA